MKELIVLSLSWSVLPFTVLLLIMFLYWFTVILGMIDIDFIDVDFEMDADADVDADADAEGGSRLGAVMDFFHANDVPIMIPLSFGICSLWFLAVTGNHLFNPGGNWLVGAGLMIPNLIVSGLIMKVATRPLAGMFKAMNKDYDAPARLEGNVGIVRSLTLNERHGQVEVATKGAPLVLNAVTEGGAELKKGDEVLIVRRNREKNLYVVEPINLEE